MEKKDYYLFKDLLVAVRKEYLKNQMELDLLKSFVIADSKKIEMYCFSVSNENLILKYKRQKGILELVKRKMECITGIERYMRFSKGQNKCQIPQKFFSDFSIDNMSLFLEQADKIYTSDFMKNVILDKQYFESSLMDLSISHNYLNLMNEYGGDSITYNPQSDKIIFNIENRKYLKDSICKLLNQKIPSEILSDYHLNVLEKLNSTSQLVLPNELCNNEYYSIFYENPKLILKK